jgi:hypothetical protein
MLVIDHGFDGSNALESYQRLQKFHVVPLYVLVISPMAHGKIFNMDVGIGPPLFQDAGDDFGEWLLPRGPAKGTSNG